MHVALVGFSVSADPHGYAKHLSLLAERAGLYSLEVIGIGGLHPRDMCFLIDKISFSKKPDLIVYEILTSSARSSTRPAAYIRKCLAHLVSAASEVGADSAILNLYRHDVNYESDVFLSSAKDFARDHGVALIDLSADAIEVIAKTGKEESLSDVVHPRRDLVKVYASRVHEAILDLVPVSAPRQIERQPWGDIVQIPAAGQKVYAFERSGLKLTCVEISEDDHVCVALPADHNLVGIVCLMGPESGKLRLRLDNKQVVEVLPYDDRSYYERLGFFYFGPYTCNEVEIIQMPGVPNIPLVKGEVSTAPRLGRIYGLLVERIAKL